MTEDGMTASGYGAENGWEVRAVRYSPVGDEVIPSNAKNAWTTHCALRLSLRRYIYSRFTYLGFLAYLQRAILFNG